ncbi:class I SAM-dependent methyltransferase [Paralcaligenes ureilyticus]|uniref:Methyltransferase family protein n=1 Tax=Paralcaligenes ureilyticus TaxID=627131 RepID=A0A4R3MAH3_9BURK|nr:class I SAM-dependent methyltransferase [Paralcaligenes ureilyticus]TCT10480.1 methyltransferase family protein [Paralcaligenes ureilyticus]
MDQYDLVNRQFGSTAKNYLTSAVHAQGADLQRLTRRVQQQQPNRILDLGCGGGHASYAAAAGAVGQVVAYDLSEEMLGVVKEEATRRGLGNLTTQQGSVDALPFADASFELIVSRYSAHHWMQIEASIAEAARVLAPGGTLIIIDVVAPQTPLYDTVLQTIELLRDASHVRDYRESEWRAMLGAAGLCVDNSDTWKLALNFDAWIKRIGTAPARVAALQTTMGALPKEARDYFSIQADCSFAIDTAWIESSRPAGAVVAGCATTT